MHGSRGSFGPHRPNCRFNFWGNLVRGSWRGGRLKAGQAVMHRGPGWPAGGPSREGTGSGLCQPPLGTSGRQQPVQQGLTGASWSPDHARGVPSKLRCRQQGQDRRPTPVVSDQSPFRYAGAAGPVPAGGRPWQVAVGPCHSRQGPVGRSAGQSRAWHQNSCIWCFPRTKSVRKTVRNWF